MVTFVLQKCTRESDIVLYLTLRGALKNALSRSDASSKAAGGVAATTGEFTVTIEPTRLTAPAATYHGRSGRRRAMRVGVATVITALLAGGSSASYAAVKALDGGGAQPEGALPSTVLAVAKIDMDPAFGQKRAIHQLSAKFPKAKTKNAGSVKDDLLRSLFSESDFNYDRDIRSWVGQRAAIGVVADPSDPSGFAPIAAIQYTDVTKTRAALRRIHAAAVKAGGETPFFALKNGYVLAAETQAKADAAAAEPMSLSAVAGYVEAMSALQGDQIATSWVNLKAVYLATPRADRKNNPVFASLTSMPTGYLVLGVHAASSFVEMQGKAVGMNEETLASLYGGVGSTAGRNLLASYPADTWAGVDAVGLGDAVTKYYNASPMAKEPGVKADAKRMGLTLPADIKTLLGDETAVGVMGAGKFDFVGRVLSATPAASAGLATKVVTSMAHSRQQASGLVRTEADGYYVGSSKAAVVKAATGTAKLGATASFKRAVPDAATAGLTVYVNIQGALRAFDSFDSKPDVHNETRYLDAFGFTADPATSSFRMRITVK